jgi:hypothetical protein
VHPQRRPVGTAADQGVVDPPRPHQRHGPVAHQRVGRVSVGPGSSCARSPTRRGGRRSCRRGTGAGENRTLAASGWRPGRPAAPRAPGGRPRVLHGARHQHRLPLAHDLAVDRPHRLVVHHQHRPERRWGEHLRHHGPVHGSDSVAAPGAGRRGARRRTASG